MIRIVIWSTLFLGVVGWLVRTGLAALGFEDVVLDVITWVWVALSLLFLALMGLAARGVKREGL